LVKDKQAEQNGRWQLLDNYSISEQNSTLLLFIRTKNTDYPIIRPMYKRGVSLRDAI
jgi:hypothetical protein